MIWAVLAVQCIPPNSVRPVLLPLLEALRGRSWGMLTAQPEVEATKRNQVLAPRNPAARP